MAQLNLAIDELLGYGKQAEQVSTQGQGLVSSLSWLWGGGGSAPAAPPPLSTSGGFSIGEFFKSYGLYIGLAIGGVVLLKFATKGK